MTTKSIIWILGIYLLFIIAGCASRDEGTKPGSSIVAFVAVSTKDAVQEIGDLFAKETGVGVKINADDSSKLATQILQGAPADIFISANEKWADLVRDKGFVQEMKDLLGNSLVIVTPQANPAKVERPEDLTQPKVQRVAVAGPTVPAGIYARQALQKLKLWDRLEQSGKVVSGENVRVTLTYVERGETEAGIVYATDALISNQVKTVFTFPESLHDPIRYPLALLKREQAHPSGRAFFDFLRSSPALAAFRKRGFTVLDGR